MEPIEVNTAIDSFFSIFWLFATLIICHFVISSAGFLFVEAEILRQGNEELLNSLDEGLVIVDQNDYDDVVFLNKSAMESKSANMEESAFNIANGGLSFIDTST